MKGEKTMVDPAGKTAVLDDAEARAARDPRGMLRRVVDLPEQLQEAAAIGAAVQPKLPQEIKHVLILGMGGSAIGGDLVKALVEAECRVPIAVSREYDVPAFVGPHTLVIASSYSGNTEETLSACRAAAERGAAVAAVTTGGVLAEWASAKGWPLVRLPQGLAPRAALGYSFVPLLKILEAAGIVSPKDGQLQEAVGVLKAMRDELGPDAPVQSNAAKQLAARLFGKLPLVYGTGGWRSAAAYRWKCQINENAKAPAWCNTFPELNHNETVGWEVPQAVTGLVELVVLRDRADSPRINRRIEVTVDIMRPAIAGVTEVWSRGESELARLLSLTYFGDFTSVYLALLNGVDPTPVRVIDRLKAELATLGPIA
ncbi:MAG: bifunctional phosphoglucose/phosphomannose isomerase [Firmicutes bacterium]|nr:bifunctional phosphoglucose/phosphomannose isomerase [Bacillota bacterium]